MATALAEMDLGAGHEEAAVLRDAHRAVQRCVETRPAGAALEFRLRTEQLLPTAGADERAVPLLRIQRTGAGALRAVLAQHRELLRGQLRVPLLVAVPHREAFRLRRVCAAEQPLHVVRPSALP